eukprot:jgi/Botrbrau1/7715/Bobra.0159s0147.2
MASPHRVLGVPHNASISEVKQAYRKLCLEWHPDLVSADRRAEAEKVFLEISAAYERLSGGSQQTGWRNASSPGYTRGPQSWSRPVQRFSNLGVAMWLSIPLILVGVYVGQSYPRLAQDLGRPHGLWYPPVNPFLKDEVRPRLHTRNKTTSTSDPESCK